MAPMHSFSVTYAIVLRLVQKDGLIATNSRIVGQPEVIQAASNRLNWREIPIALIDRGRPFSMSVIACYQQVFIHVTEVRAVSA